MNNIKQRLTAGLIVSPVIVIPVASIILGGSIFQTLTLTLLWIIILLLIISVLTLALLYDEVVPDRMS